jgi:hypothetical protein
MTPATSRTDAPETPEPQPIDLTGFAWALGGSTIVTDPDGRHHVRGLTVAVGDLAGENVLRTSTMLPQRALELDVVAPPFVSNPWADTVTFGQFDGRQSQVFAARPDSAAAAPIFSSPAIITAALAIPGSRRLVATVRDQATYADLGLFEYALNDPAAAPRELIRTTPAWAAYRNGDFDTLFVSADERFVVQVACSGGVGCRLRWVDREGGRTDETLGLDFGLVIGLAGHVAVVTALTPEQRAACELRCPALAIDLTTGGVRPMGELCADDAVVAEGASGPVVVYASEHPFCGDDRYRISAINLLTGRPVPVTAPAGARLSTAIAGGSIRLSTPPGSWVMAHETEPLAWLVTADGATFELQRPADWGG